MNKIPLLRTILTHRYLPMMAAVLGVALGLPTLWYGWGLDDDLLQRTMLLSSSLPEALARLFVFLDPSTNRALMDSGALPWWTLDTVRVSFLRPIAVLSLWLDYRLWPNSAMMMHAHSVLWYAGLCALVATVYRRMMGRGVAAGLGTVLFTVNVTHIGCVTALNARNVLQAAFFGVLTLSLHDRGRRGGWRAGTWLAPLSLALALLSAEAGIATMAYLAAYALCVDRGTWPERIKSLLPYAGVIIIWRLGYQYLGYGAWASDFYVDPGREPLRFAAAILERGPVLLLGQWAMPDPAVYAVLSAGARPIYWLAAMLFVMLMGAVLFPLFRHSRVTRFWGLGMLLAVGPICAVNPASGRHLVFVGLGAIALMAQLIASLAGRRKRLPTRRAWRIPAWTMGLLLFGLQGAIYPILLHSVQDGIGPLYREVMDIGPLPGVERQDVVIANAPSPGQFIYVPSLRASVGQPLPAHMRILAPAHSAVTITRVDGHTVIVRPERGYLLRPDAPLEAERNYFPLVHPVYASRYGDGFTRSGAFPMAQGQQVTLTGMQVEVTALTDDGRPAEARMTFSRPLEDPSLRWLQWDWDRNAYIPFALPAIGETARIPGPF